jgi:hypothetical protein
MIWTKKKSETTENWIIWEGHKVIAIVLAREDTEEIAESIVERHNEGLAEPTDSVK